MKVFLKCLGCCEPQYDLEDDDLDALELIQLVKNVVEAPARSAQGARRATPMRLTAGCHVIAEHIDA